MDTAIFISGETANRVANSLEDAHAAPLCIRGELKGYIVIWSGEPMTNEEVEALGI